MQTVAALYVVRNGSYFDLAGVDPWDEARDARQYTGPYPVVAHPPCQRWGKMWFGSPLTVKRTGIRKIKGDDGGCFAAALRDVRRYGGVIEHPWESHAWPHFGLAVPPRAGGWVKADEHGGWTCCIEQRPYGHYARKPTLLLVYGYDEEELPDLLWGRSEPQYDPALVERIGLKRAKKLGEVCSKGGGTDSNIRNGTPLAFRDLLLSIARGVKRPLDTNNQQVHTPEQHKREGKTMSVELKVQLLSIMGGDLVKAQSAFAWVQGNENEAAPSATPAPKPKATSAKKTEESASSAETVTQPEPSEPDPTPASEQVIEGSTVFNGDIDELRARCMKLGSTEEGKTKLAEVFTQAGSNGKWSGVTDHAALHAQLEAVGA